VAARLASLATSLLALWVGLSIFNAAEFGVWVTLSSVTTLLYLFDFGFGSGIVSQLADARSRGDREREALSSYATSTASSRSFQPAFPSPVLRGGRALASVAGPGTIGRPTHAGPEPHHHTFLRGHDYIEVFCNRADTKPASVTSAHPTTTQPPLRHDDRNPVSTRTGLLQTPIGAPMRWGSNRAFGLASASPVDRIGPHRARFAAWMWSGHVDEVKTGVH
jgi:hypothetical protein